MRCTMFVGMIFLLLSCTKQQSIHFVEYSQTKQCTYVYTGGVLYKVMSDHQETFKIKIDSYSFDGDTLFIVRGSHIFMVDPAVDAISLVPKGRGKACASYKGMLYSLQGDTIRVDNGAAVRTIKVDKEYEAIALWNSHFCFLRRAAVLDVYEIKSDSLALRTSLDSVRDFVVSDESPWCFVLHENNHVEKYNCISGAIRHLDTPPFALTRVKYYNRAHLLFMIAAQYIEIYNVETNGIVLGQAEIDDCAYAVDTNMIYSLIGTTIAQRDLATKKIVKTIALNINN